jgi:hypothetical protein
MRGSSRALLRKHSRLLVWSGALIVFLTFVFKEGLGQHWRDVSEAISKAQDVYLEQVERSSAQERYTDLRRSITEVWDSLEIVLKHRGESSKNFLLRFSFRESMESATEKLANIERLESQMKLVVEAIPESDNTIRWTVLSKEFKKATAEELLVKGKVDTSMAFDNMELGPPTWKYSSAKKQHEGARTGVLLGMARLLGSEAIGRSANLLVSLDDLNFDMDKVAKDLLNEAEHSRQRNQLYSTIAWWISTFLFALGWGIGLLGKLYGVPEAAGE